MSFWNTSKSTPVVAQTEVDQNNDLPPIPTGTLLKSVVTEAKWEDTRDEDAEEKGARHIKLRWDVIDGDYKNRVIFQKLFVESTKDKQRDNALEMFAAIDMNAGGKLMASGEEPSDMSMMQNLCNKPMVIRAAVWSIPQDDGTKIQGNWINGVFSGTTQTTKPAVAKPSNDLPGF